VTSGVSRADARVEKHRSRRLRRPVWLEVVGIDDRAADGGPAQSATCGTTLSDGSVVADGYRLVEAIGHGATSVVYSAHRLDLDRMVALKILTVDPGDDHMGDRLQREARLVAGIAHPALTQIYGAGITDDSRPPDYSLPELKSFSDKETSP
jgi:serine/threonine protein kinase